MKKLAIGLYLAITAALLAWGFYQAIYVAPADAMQGEVYRIIFYHVPSASVAFLFFAISLAGSIGFLALRRNHANRAQIADAWALAGAMPEPESPPKTGAGCWVRHQRFDI